ncbi:FAD:protein FMN transferase [Brevibacillus ginsengisoli]|uniref:FAD:protein FMN transferase n=1 Tax=Brevibacillus ginsengisoli TaxID=363854 RepID=UPI003CEED2C4
MHHQVKLYHHTSFAMNTTIETILESTSDEKSTHLNNMVQKWFRSTESRFSRFQPDSELSLLNSHSGKLVLISDDMAEVLSLAQNFSGETQGIFTPFVYDALVAAGYDRSFEKVKEGSRASSPAPQPRDFSMFLDVGMKAVQLQAGTRIDLGGIVKGWSAERLSKRLVKKQGVKRGLMNAGGDIQVWGGSSADEPWNIGIANPWDKEKEIALVSLENGAVATSNVIGRSWKREQGREGNHIIDPRTMQSCTSDVAQCSIVGESLTQCEIWAKVACIVGVEQAISLLTKHVPRLEALIVTKTGDVHFIGDEHSLQNRWEVESLQNVHKPARNEGED